MPVPDGHTQGIALVGERLWAVNSRAKQLQEFNPRDGRLISSVDAPVKAVRGLAWDGKALWCTDDAAKMVHQLDPATGRIMRSLAVPIYGDKKAAHLEAVAWNGKDLWVAYSAGYSSRIHRMNAQTGEIVLSMLAKCLPRGLSADTKHLWVVAYNGERHPGAIIRRIISDDAGKMNLSRTVIARTQGRKPTAIALDGQHLWVADRDMKVLQKVAIPRGR